MSDNKTYTEGTGFMLNGFVCCYDALDFEDVVFCCVGGGDCLCIRQNMCCAAGAKNRGVGMTTEPEKGECCKLGLYCCDIGLVQPTALCTSTAHCLCCKSVKSLPCTEDYVPQFVCAYCGIGCAPKFGCCIAPPECKAAKALMDRE